MILNAILSALNCKIILGSIFWPHQSKNPPWTSDCLWGKVELGKACRAAQGNFLGGWECRISWLGWWLHGWIGLWNSCSSTTKIWSFFVYTFYLKYCCRKIIWKLTELRWFKTSRSCRELHLLTGSPFGEWRRNFPDWMCTLKV